MILNVRYWPVRDLHLDAEDILAYRDFLDALRVPFIIDHMGRVVAAPGRVLWGTDFPHPNVRVMPNDGELVDLFAAMCDDESMRRRILVDNPTRLYWSS